MHEGVKPRGPPYFETAIGGGLVVFWGGDGVEDVGSPASSGP